MRETCANDLLIFLGKIKSLKHLQWQYIRILIHYNSGKFLVFSDYLPCPEILLSKHMVEKNV